MNRRPGWFSRNFGALEERNFRLLWIGQTGSTVGDGLSFVAIAFAVIGIGGSATDIGLVFAAFSLPHVLFLLAGGVWADRLSRNLVMLTADGLRATVQAWLAFLLFTGQAELWNIFVVAAVHGTASAFFQPASTGLMPQVVSPGRLQQANALMALSRGMAFVVGPALSGIIVASGGPGYVFAIDAVSYLLSMGTLALLRLPPPPPVEEREPFFHELAAGWREVRSRSWLIACLLTFAVSNVALGSSQILGPLIVDRDLGGAADWGFISTAGAVGALAGGAVALRWRPSRPLVAGFLLMLLSLPRSLALIPPLSTLALAGVAAMALFAIQISNTLWETVLQQRIPQSALSRVSSYDWIVSLAFQPIAFTIVGPMTGLIGEDQTLLLFGVLTVANLAVLLVPSVRNMRRLDVSAEPLVEGASVP
jgi:MFS family permease